MSLFKDTKTRELGFGCMGISAFYGKAMSAADGAAVLQGAYDAGYRHFDTAEIYRSDFPKPPTETSVWNEVMVGQFIATVPRESVTVATKFMPFMHTLDVKGVTEALDASLARLGLEYVDIYYCHRMPKTLDGLLEFMASAKTLVEAGKIKHIGLSEVSPAWLRAAYAVHPVSAVQQEWSLLTRDHVENLLAPVCSELNIAVVAYSPLARNLLAAASEAPPTDWRASLPRYSAENFARNQALLAQIATMGTEKKASTAQLSLAYLYHTAEKLGFKLVAIPGTTKVPHAVSNIASIAIQLSDAELEALAKVGAAVAGNRADDGYLNMALDGHHE